MTGKTLLACIIFAMNCQTALADTLIDQVLPLMKADDQHQWSLIRTATDFDSKGNPKNHTVAQYDGSQPEGQRWSLMMLDNRAPSLRDINNFSTTFNKVPSLPCYSSMAAYLERNPKKISEKAGLVTYRVTNLPPGSTMLKGHDVSKFLMADLVIDQNAAQPYLREVHIFAPEPFRPLTGAKVNHLDRVLHFTLNALGLPVLADHNMQGDGSLMFVPINFHQYVQFSGHTIVNTRLAAAAGTSTGR